MRQSPYGTHRGYEYDWDDNERQFLRANRAQQMPIHGPPNWDQIWPGWTQLGDDNVECDAAQQRMFQAAANYEGLVRNVTFEQALGGGGFGQVYRVRASMTDSGQEVRLACKVMRLNMDSYARKYAITPLTVRVNEMLNDIYVLAHLKHPNIVEYKDVMYMSDRQTCFPFSTVLLFMELCHGHVHQWINELGLGYMPDVTARQMIKEIGEGLQYLHMQDIAHLDIKPENILFTKHGDNIVPVTFKLADFGNAQVYGRWPNLIEQKTGTPGYFAPEQYSFRSIGRPIAARPCDVYALGITLAFCLLRDNQYRQRGVDLSRDIDGLMNNVMQGVSQLLSRGAAQLILNMVATDPFQRYSISRVLSDPFVTQNQAPVGNPLKRRLDDIPGYYENETEDEIPNYIFF